MFGAIIKFPFNFTRVLSLVLHARRANRPSAHLTQPTPPSTRPPSTTPLLDLFRLPSISRHHLSHQPISPLPSTSNRTPVYQPLKHRYANLYVCPHRSVFYWRKGAMYRSTRSCGRAESSCTTYIIPAGIIQYILFGSRPSFHLDSTRLDHIPVPHRTAPHTSPALIPIPPNDVW